MVEYHNHEKKFRQVFRSNRDSIRERPIRSRRFTEPNSFIIKDEEDQVYQSKQINWLAKSWKQYKTGDKNSIVMPTRHELMSGILNEASYQIEMTFTNDPFNMIKEYRRIVQSAWIVFFRLSKMGKNKLNEPIDECVNGEFARLLNSNSPLCSLILYLYSMESFISREFNNASLSQDKNKVQTLGPIAVALETVI